MKNKKWFEIWLTCTDGGTYTEMLARVNSKGNTYTVLQALKPIYENDKTVYKLIVK